MTRPVAFPIGQTESGPLAIDLGSLLSTRALVQANSGGGKSWLLRLIAEGAAGHVPILILDAEGEFATLREKYDFALAGREGELPIDVSSAEMLARKLAEFRVSAIINLSDLETLPAKREYVRIFLESLISVPRKFWGPMLVLIDEAHRFAPKQGEAESTGAVVTLMDAGRKRGFCGVVATQRLSKLHNDVAAEANNIFIGRTWLDNDQERAGDMLGMKKADRQVLRSLAQGEFFAFGPALSVVGVSRFHSAAVSTTHPKPGERHSMDVPKASAHIRDIVEQLGDVPAQAEEKASELEAAQKRAATAEREVITLKRQLQTRPVQQQLVPEKVIERVEVTVFKDGEVSRLEKVVEGLAKVGEQFSSFGENLIAAGSHLIITSNEVNGALHAAANRPQPKPTITPLRTQLPARPLASPRPAPTQRPATSSQEVQLPPGEKAVLSAVIQYPNGLRREQLTVLTGYKRSSRNAYIDRLRTKGYIATDRELVTATENGIAALPNAEPLPTGAALQEFWLAKLPEGERRVLQVLIDNYPLAVSRESIDEATGYKRSSRDAYLNRMSAKELVTEPTRGQVRASDSLFGD